MSLNHAEYLRFPFLLLISIKYWLWSFIKQRVQSTNETISGCITRDFKKSVNPKFFWGGFEKRKYGRKKSPSPGCVREKHNKLFLFTNYQFIVYSSTDTDTNRYVLWMVFLWRNNATRIRLNLLAKMSQYKKQKRQCLHQNVQQSSLKLNAIIHP